MSLVGQLLAAINSLRKQHGNAPIVLTGHSLGGAVATVAAMDLGVVQGLPVAKLTTFGSPRCVPAHGAFMLPHCHSPALPRPRSVGNDVFAMTLRTGVQQSVRVTHNADIVPHVPPMSFGFHHVANEVWYNEASTSYRVCDTSGEDPSCSNSVALPVSTSDHGTYLIPISKLC